jgi:hypothetical protein
MVAIEGFVPLALTFGTAFGVHQVDVGDQSLHQGLHLALRHQVGAIIKEPGTSRLCEGCLGLQPRERASTHVIVGFVAGSKSIGGGDTAGPCAAE